MLGLAFNYNRFWIGERNDGIEGRFGVLTSSKVRGRRAMSIFSW